MPSRVRDYPPGTRVPGTVYEVIRVIGAGGMGTVYDVEDTTIGKRYVLKTLHPQLGAREDLARRMQNESRALARLNHSNIVDVITAGVTADDLRLPYYVMEKLNGQSLRAVLEKKGQLELPHAFHIGIDLLDALDHAHDKGVIHRDVKPDNIFLHRTAAGVTVTKLLDFGILSLLDTDRRETAGRFVGTLRYAAPEQLRGEKATPKVDVYAASLVLYEMIAGRGPFDDEGSPHAIGAAHLHMAPPPLSSFVAVPRDLEAIIMGALSKDPKGRPQDAFTFVSTLRELKRSLVGVLPRESTEDRATASAVMASDSSVAPYVDVRQAGADGAYVISPVLARPTAPQTSFPRTTIPGVALPTLAPSRSDAVQNERTATNPGVVDRSASTRSLVPDTVAAPQYGTEEIGKRGLSTPPSSTSGPEWPDESPFQWPAESGPAMSEEPHVQTLLLHSRRSPRWAIPVVAAATIVGATTALGIVVFARHSPPSKPTSWTAPMARETAPPPPVLSVASPPPPASASSPPMAAGVPSANVAVTASPRPISTSRDKARPATSAAAKSSASPFVPRPDRPGPGF